MLFRLSLCCLLVTFGLKYANFQAAADCRCTPNRSCWPAKSDWEGLNRSIDGILSRLRPVGSVCHSSGYSADLCAELIKNAFNTTWRVLQPAALQATNWEHWQEEQKHCYVQDGNVSQCDQGRVALYSAAVTSFHQVQEVVRFARAKRLRLTIRNTGHDLAGRSTAPGSLQIHTEKLKGIHYTDNFQPHGPRGQQIESEGPAVTVGAGVLTGELYAAAADGGWTVVGGSCSTVGIAGGWMQGGGYGILSPSKGLGSDNVLEISLVTANGAYVTANRYQNQDLFWAVRGGGGGTFGVVTSVTFQAFPDVSATITRFQVSSRTADQMYWKAMEELFVALPPLLDCGIAVQSFGIPFFPPGDATLILEVYSINQTETACLAAIEKLRNTLEALEPNGLNVDSSVEFFERLSSFLAIPKGLNQAGQGVLTASVLASRNLLMSSKGPSRLVTTLSELQYHPGDVISIDGMGGGQVVANRDRVSSAIHPDWRSSLLSLTLARPLRLSPDWADHQAVADELANTQLPLLQSVEDGQMGAYLGIPFPYETNHSSTFWGANYNRLLQIKGTWDPDDLFVTRIGVGSERWDAEGMCRRQVTGLLVNWELYLTRVSIMTKISSEYLQSLRSQLEDILHELESVVMRTWSK